MAGMELATTQVNVGQWGVQQQMGALSNTSDPEPWLIETLGGPESHSGIRVNEHTVLTSGPVYQAVNILSSGLASLPLEVLTAKGGKNVKTPDHAAAMIWNHLGNDEMLPYHVRQTLLSWGFLHGNGLGAIHWDHGRAVGVYPLRPGSVWLDRLHHEDDVSGRPTGQLIYRFATDHGNAGILFPHEVFHFKTMGNGLWGYSQLGLFRNTFGNGMAIEKYQGKHFSNEARPAGVLTHEGKMKPEARANLRREWNEVHQGLDNTNKIAVLWDGMKWQSMSVSNKDAEMLQSRKFYREEVAAIYNLPPHMLGAMENSAVRANIEEQNRAYVRHALIPHDMAWSQETKRKFCTHQERHRCVVTVKHNFKALLRGDLQTRYNAYSIGRQWGWLSANDVLRLEDMDEIGEKGDIYMVPSNMADAETKEPFVAKKQVESSVSTQVEKESTQVDDSNEQGLLAFARTAMFRAQTREIKSLRRAVKERRTPFGKKVDKFYATFPDYLAESLEALSTVSGFVDGVEMRAVVEEYTNQSLSSLENIQTEDELLSEVLTWPARVETMIGQLVTKE